MKALTLWDPWAWLMAHEFKRVETRIWASNYRGDIAIHAALRKPDFLGASANTSGFTIELEACSAELYRKDGTDRRFHPGCVLAIAELYAIRETHEVRDELSKREFLFGNYEDDRYAWFFRNVRRFAEPIPVKGNRMLWNWAP